MNIHMFYVLVACLYNYGLHGHFGLTTVKQRVVWRAWYFFGSRIQLYSLGHKDERVGTKLVRKGRQYNLWE